MKVADLLERRRSNWRLLEEHCAQMERRRRRRASAAAVARFAALYRAACADLALADAYQLPPGTVAYLHELVGRAHNQLYRSRTFNLALWQREMFYSVPQRLFADRCFWLAFALFWSFFGLSMLLANNSLDYCRAIVHEEMADDLLEQYARPLHGRAGTDGALMVGFYIANNIGIALRCFAGGMLLGVGGIFITVYQAVFLGAVFGFMRNTPQWPNFREFVTAHGPFELNAIVLAAAAGMRLGFAIVNTGGLGRLASLQQAGRETMPLAAAAMVLLFSAALIEGFVSPSGIPYAWKQVVAILSTALLVAYFIGLGVPRRDSRAT